MTLVDNGLERETPETASQSDDVRNAPYVTKSLRGARTVASFNAPYFEGRDIAAGALAAFMLLAPLAVGAFG
jgi:hypothetical protein